jgi:hypothetical protein
MDSIARRVSRKGGRTNKVCPESSEPTSLYQQRASVQVTPNQRAGIVDLANDFTTTSGDKSPTSSSEDEELHQSSNKKRGHFTFFLCH